MVYKINKTDGTEITQIPDGRFDTSTSLTLIGKNVTSFGEVLNENLIKLLENFSSSSQPQKAIRGQLWYDTGAGRLNVYDGNGFRVTGGPIISPVQPQNLVAGDLWIDNRENQLYFYDGTDLVLTGPIFSSTQGTTGFKAETLLDRVNGQSRVVASLYVGGVLLGIFSSSDFVPTFPIPGYGPPQRPINKGFNAASTIEMKFDVSVTRAQNLVLNNGDLKSAEEVAFKNLENIFTQPISILNNSGIKIGATNQMLTTVVENNVILENTIPDRDFSIKVKQGVITNNALTIKGATSRIGIWNENPQYNLDITGNMRISGNFIVGGETVTINTTTLTTQDKNIELNFSENGFTSDVSADGGGIILKGNTDKTILYIDATESWDFSENLNLIAGKKLKIDNVSVIEQVPNTPGEYQLGVNVTTAPGLTTIGTLTNLNAGQVQITTNRISTPVDTDMEFNIPGNGNVVLTSGGQIKGIDLPTDLQDVTSKIYTDTKIYNKPVSLSLDITGYKLYTGDDDNASIAAILDIIAPYYDLADPGNTPNGVASTGTRLYLHAVTTEITNQSYSLPPTAYNYGYELVPSQDGSSLASVLNNLTIEPFPALTSTITKIRRNKLFIMSGGNNPQLGRWGFSIDLGPSTITTA